MHLSAFEKVMHGTLFEDYKSFLKNENDGWPKHNLFGEASHFLERNKESVCDAIRKK